MTEAAWHAVNGDVTAAALETAAELLPQPLLIRLKGQRFVMVPYDMWKEKSKRRQQEET